MKKNPGQKVLYHMVNYEQQKFLGVLTVVLSYSDIHVLFLQEMS